MVACDTETTGLRLWHGDKPFAFSFCNEEGETAYVEWTVNPNTREPEPNARELKRLRAFFEDDSVTKVFHHAKFDVRALERGWGIRVAGPGGLLKEGGRFEETVFAAHAVNPLEPSFGLKDLARRYCGVSTDDQDDLKAEVVRLRRHAKAEGWQIGAEVRFDSEGNQKIDSNPEADYWLPWTCWSLGKRFRSWLTAPGMRYVCKRYAVLDAERTMLLWKGVEQQMEREKVRDTYEREIEVWKTVYRMEDRGVCVNNDRLREDTASAKVRLRELREELVSKWGWDGINLRSPKQVGDMLYNPDKKVSLPLPKSGKPETGIETLALSANHPAVNLLLRFRSYEKALGSFYLPYAHLGKDDEVRGHTVLHADFKQTGTDTGRFSCSRPNLQQVSDPKKARHGIVLPIRRAFGPRPGTYWVGSDYVGQEIRIIADLADEPSMLKAIKEGRDVHSMVVATVYKKPGNPLTVRQAVRSLCLDGRNEHPEPEVLGVWKELGVRRALSQKDADRAARAWLDRWEWDIEKAEKSIGKKNTRGRTKQVVFGRAYGAEARTTAQTLQCSLEEARELLHQFDQEFYRIKEYMEELTREARRNGYVRTRWNRRLRIRSGLEYQSVNYMVQGTAADLLKNAMVLLTDWFDRDGIDANVLIPIHDELVVEVSQADCTLDFVRTMDRLMSDTGNRLRVPMPTEPMLVTRSWDNPKRIKGFKYAA